MPDKDTASGGNRNDSWQSRRVASGLLLTFINFGPAAVAVLLSVVVSHVVHRPADLGGTLFWLAGLCAVSLAVIIGLDKLFRRLLPLATLLRLTLVFPDRAPSRFKSAIRNSSARDLERRVSQALEGGQPGETLNDAAIRIVELSTMLTAHDRRTRGHCERVRAYAEMMAEELHLSNEDKNKLRWGAMLHDIGKLAVPAAILNKNGRPDAHEWEAIKKHPDESRRLLAPILDWLGPWAAAAWEHHERWDGDGYPLGLAGKEITLAGRLVAVADSFEVMTATRSYKKPYPPEEARRELQRCAGTQFDPEMVRALLTVSIGRLRWEMGPVAWLAQLPFLSWTVPAATAAPTTIATVGRAVTVAGLLHSAAPVGAAATFVANAATGGNSAQSLAAHTQTAVLADSASPPAPASVQAVAAATGSSATPTTSQATGGAKTATTPARPGTCTPPKAPRAGRRRPPRPPRTRPGPPFRPMDRTTPAPRPPPVRPRSSPRTRLPPRPRRPPRPPRPPRPRSPPPSPRTAVPPGTATAGTGATAGTAGGGPAMAAPRCLGARAAGQGPSRATASGRATGTSPAEPAAEAAVVLLQTPRRRAKAPDRTRRAPLCRRPRAGRTADPVRAPAGRLRRLPDRRAENPRPQAV